MNISGTLGSSIWKWDDAVSDTILDYEGSDKLTFTDLVAVDIGNTVTSIDEGALEGSGITSVVIPDSVTSIRSFAFRYCTNLTNVTIPDSMTGIGDEAFKECSRLTSLTIGNGVTSIGVDAFYRCTSVTDVYCYPNPANLTWDETGCDDFKSDGSTVCHVKSEYLSTYQSKFSG